MFFMDFLTVRRLQARRFSYTLTGAVPAANGGNAGALEINLSIQTGFHFWSEVLTVSFTTVNSAGVDDGVNQLTCQFKDGANQIGLSNTFVDLSTISAPGRQRATGLAGDPSNQLATTGIPFPHLWLGTGSIIADLRNASNTANQFRATFGGYLIPESKIAEFDAYAASASGPGNMIG